MILKMKEGFDTEISDDGMMPLEQYRLELLESINEELKGTNGQVMMFLSKNIAIQPKVVNQWYDYDHAHGYAIKDILVGLFGEVGRLVSEKICKYA